MSQPDEDWVVEVSHVTKKFRLVEQGKSLKSAALDLLRRRARPDTGAFTALDDVSFRLRRGETLGIIGENGAGKSTLLSIIAGTLSPTSGSVKVKGSVGSLLELGAGFHPDLTGRENVMLYGSIMGVPRAEMQRRFDDIVSFAGLGDFIDQPVRFYSSGMYVRLGFSVAVQVDPDILLVDEVLAVGDMEFQRKCLAKMDEFRTAGKSMILISHDTSTIRRVSSRIAYLSHGKVKDVGDPFAVSKRYQDEAFLRDLDSRRREWGNNEARFTSVAAVDPESGRESEGPVFESTADKVLVRLRWHASRRLKDPVVGFSLEELGSGVRVCGSNTQIAGRALPPLDGDGSIDLELDVRNLQQGDFLLSVSLHSGDHKTNWHRLENTLLLRLRGKRWFDGITVVPAKWS